MKQKFNKINSQHSTTSRLIEINSSDLFKIIEQYKEAKIQSVPDLFLSGSVSRLGEGGLRTKDCFKVGENKRIQFLWLFRSVCCSKR